MFRRSFSPCSVFALCHQLRRCRRRDSEHYSSRIIVALIAMISRILENGDDPSGNNRIPNDSSVTDQSAFQVPQNEGRIVLNVF
jgi:hypothetical protein